MRRAILVAGALILSFLFVAEPAAAQTKRPAFINGGELERACDGYADTNAGLCLGYVLGTADMWEMMATAPRRAAPSDVSLDRHAVFYLTRKPAARPPCYADQ